MPDAAREKAKKESRNADSSSGFSSTDVSGGELSPGTVIAMGEGREELRGGGCPRRRASANVKRDHAVFSQTSAT